MTVAPNDLKNIIIYIYSQYVTKLRSTLGVAIVRTSWYIRMTESGNPQILGGDMKILHWLRRIFRKDTATVPIEYIGDTDYFD